MAPRRNLNNSPQTQLQLNDLNAAAVHVHTIEDPIADSNYNYPNNSSLPTIITATETIIPSAGAAKVSSLTALYNRFYANCKELSPIETVPAATITTAMTGGSVSSTISSTSASLPLNVTSTFVGASLSMQQQHQQQQQQQQSAQRQPQQFNNMSPMPTTNNKSNNSSSSSSNNINNTNTTTTINNNSNNSNIIISNSCSNTLANHQHKLNTNNVTNNANANATNANDQLFVKCCYPIGDCRKTDTNLISCLDLSDCVKVICNNENCSMSQYMHKQCFDDWEQSILASLKNMNGGRVRGWSDRQKVHNIWTKKGYDLIFKLCNCKCNRGHLRKDLEWIAAKTTVTAFNSSNVGQQQRITMNDLERGCGGGGLFEEDDKKIKNNGNGGGSSNSSTNSNNNNNNNSSKKKRNRSNTSSSNNSSINGSNNSSNMNTNNNGNNNSIQQKLNNCSAQLMQQTSQNYLPQEPSSVLNECLSNSVTEDISGYTQIRNSYNNLLPAPNVGVIGSGLPQHNYNNGNSNMNQLQSILTSCVADGGGKGGKGGGGGGGLLGPAVPSASGGIMGSLLLNNSAQSPLTNSIGNNGNNILGLDLITARTNSVSSGSNNSGTSTPTVLTTAQRGMGGGVGVGGISSDQFNYMQLKHLQHNFNTNGFYGQQQPQQQQQQQIAVQSNQNSIQQAPPAMAASLTKTLLNGLNNLGSTVLLGNNNGNTNLSVGGTNAVTNVIHGTVPSTSNPTSNALILHQQQQQQQQSNNILNGHNFKHLTSYEQQQFLLQQKLQEVEIYSEKVRSTSGCNGIFSRRLDFSSFNLLPKTRLNSYQVKIEDEGNHGNDETRLFILSSLAQSQKNRVTCIICEEIMLVFDRYPLVDGSFFLSPKQHSTDCIEVKYESRNMFLTCVCMRCLDGSSTNRSISCRFCGEKWDGSNLVLGTMYAYDIFAAMPCCMERIKCNNCFKMLLHPQQRLHFYSDYSQCVTCPFCATPDAHFVKPVNYCYVKNLPSRLLGLA